MKILLLSVTFLGLLLIAPATLADELVFKFKNPSFSGVGTGAHYLTIENQEKSRRDKLEMTLRQNFCVYNVKKKTQL